MWCKYYRNGQNSIHFWQIFVQRYILPFVFTFDVCRFQCRFLCLKYKCLSHTLIPGYIYSLNFFLCYTAKNYFMSGSACQIYLHSQKYTVSGLAMQIAISAQTLFTLNLSIIILDDKLIASFLHIINIPQFSNTERVNSSKLTSNDSKSG